VVSVCRAVDCLRVPVEHTLPRGLHLIRRVVLLDMLHRELAHQIVQKVSTRRAGRDQVCLDESIQHLGCLVAGQIAECRCGLDREVRARMMSDEAEHATLGIRQPIVRKLDGGDGDVGIARHGKGSHAITAGEPRRVLADRQPGLHCEVCARDAKCERKVST
jgi:hypothetical protein